MTQQQPEITEKKQFTVPSKDEVIRQIKQLDDQIKHVSLNLIRCHFDATQNDVRKAFPQFNFVKVKNYKPGSYQVVFEEKIDAIHFVRDFSDKRILGRKFFVKIGNQSKQMVEDYVFVGYVSKGAKGGHKGFPKVEHHKGDNRAFKKGTKPQKKVGQQGHTQEAQKKQEHGKQQANPTTEQKTQVKPQKKQEEKHEHKKLIHHQKKQHHPEHKTHQHKTHEQGTHKQIKSVHQKKVHHEHKAEHKVQNKPDVATKTKPHQQKTQTKPHTQKKTSQVKKSEHHEVKPHSQVKTHHEVKTHHQNKTHTEKPKQAHKEAEKPAEKKPQSKAAGKQEQTEAKKEKPKEPKKEEEVTKQQDNWTWVKPKKGKK